MCNNAMGINNFIYLRCNRCCSKFNSIFYNYRITATCKTIILYWEQAITSNLYYYIYNKCVTIFVLSVSIPFNNNIYIYIYVFYSLSSTPISKIINCINIIYVCN